MAIEETAIARITGEAEVELRDGRLLGFAGLFTATRTTPASPIAEAAGCALLETPMGVQIRTTDSKETCPASSPAATSPERRIPFRSQWPTAPGPARNCTARWFGQKDELSAFPRNVGSPKHLSPNVHQLEIDYMTKLGEEETQLELIREDRNRVVLQLDFLACLRQHRSPLATWRRDDRPSFPVHHKWHMLCDDHLRGWLSASSNQWQSQIANSVAKHQGPRRFKFW